MRMRPCIINGRAHPTMRPGRRLPGRPTARTIWCRKPTRMVTDVPPTLSVSINGTAQQGQTLTANPLLTTDADNSVADVHYQWQRSADGTVWTDVTGATTATYPVGPADAGDEIRVNAS